MNWCSIIPWIIGIGAAILGGLIGYYLMRPKMLFYKLGLENKSKDYENLEGEYGAVKASKAETDELNIQLNAELGAEHNRAKGLNKALSEEVEFRKKLQAEVEAHQGTIGSLKADLEAKSVALSDAENKMAVSLADLNANASGKEKAFAKEVAALKALIEDKNAALKAGEEKLNFAASASEVALKELETKIEERENELSLQIGALNSELGEKDEAIKAFQLKLGSLEASEKDLNAELLLLKQELEDAQAQASASARGLDGDIAMGSGNVSADALASIKANIGKMPFEGIGGAAVIGDDLTKINNISIADEAMLNAAGINSYKQLARLQDDELATVVEVIGMNLDTVTSEDWRGQARAFVLAAVTDKDDLKKIEGIGPKIAELCNNNGIFTFEELANTKVSILKHILKEGGSRFRLADPGTWPMQARLAADGEWGQLKILQDVLDGGKFV